MPNIWLKIFSDYINNNYDMQNKLIVLKYYHSIRVAKIMQLIACRMKLNNEQVYLAYLIGLVHDLGRFKEIVRQQKFNNLKFDHGAYSNKILYNDELIKLFNISEKYALIIRKAIYFHNKKDIEGQLTSEELLYAKMIRDADKIDVLNIAGDTTRVFNREPTSKVLDAYYRGNTIDLKDIHNRSDSVILYLSFIQNMYFNISKDILKLLGYDKKILKNTLVLDKYLDLFTDLIYYKEGDSYYVKQ